MVVRRKSDLFSYRLPDIVPVCAGIPNRSGKGAEI
jgi:hypothetical protein